MMRRLALIAIALGLYLTLRGYHSRDGDQAYRLPLLLSRQDPTLYRADPFVRAFDRFNPHGGYLAILDVSSRAVGLSAALFLLFTATFAGTGLAVDRLARIAWPGSGPRVGAWAFALVLIAKAGNLGTNHLFEAMLLDRLMALALGWSAMAALVADPRGGPKWAALAIAGAGLIHPSLGLQIGLILIAGRVGWAVLGAEVGGERRSAPAGLTLLMLGLAPSLVFALRHGNRVFEGLPADEFLTLAASIQSPQHMLPHLWRMPQWLAGTAYLVLAVLSVTGGARSPGRGRLLILLAMTLAGLAVGWVGVEVLHSARMTVFQPFRLATVARGLCLVLAADRVMGLWRRGDVLGRCRALTLASGLAGDWPFVVAVAVELAATIGERWGRKAGAALALATWAGGIGFLSGHDTESGHLVLVPVALAGLLSVAVRRTFLSSLLPAGGGAPEGRMRVFRAPPNSGARRGPHPATATPPSPGGRGEAVPARRFVVLASVVWIVPVAAMILPSVSKGRLAARLAAHCRFGEWAGDDVERLAVWCREHTPADARLVGPPGPKTFRLWSRREVAFNRAASPYHAEGLADWAARFRDHVGFRGSVAEFAARYLEDRQELERGFDRLDGIHLAALARRERAGYVLASAELDAPPDAEPLERLHVEGRYAIYRVRPASGGAGASEDSITRQAGGTRPKVRSR